MMPYRLIPLISTLEEFHFLVTVGPSVPFGPVLNTLKIENFKWYLIDFISRVSKVSKTVQKTLATPKVRFFQNIPCLDVEYRLCFTKVCEMGGYFYKNSLILGTKSNVLKNFLLRVEREVQFP